MKRAVTTMKKLFKYLKIEMKISLRDPSLIFFVVIFPTMLLVFFASTIGESITANGHSFVDFYLPSVFMYAVLSSAIAGFSQITNQYQTRNIYNLYRNKGVTVSLYIVAQIMIQICFVLIGVTVSLLVGKYAYHATLNSVDKMLFLYLQIIGSCAILYLLGASFGLLFKSSGAASAFSMMVMFLLYFFSGMMVPVLQFNDTLRAVSTKLITTAMISDFGKTLSDAYLISKIEGDTPVFFEPSIWIYVVWGVGIMCLFLLVVKRQVTGKR